MWYPRSTPVPRARPRRARARARHALDALSPRVHVARGPAAEALLAPVRSKENIIGERGAVRCADSSSIAATPMQSDDSGQIVMRKVPKKRPQWQDINHQDYRCGGSAPRRPQYIERRRPHRISVRTPESARNVLMKELERAEALVKRGKGSPNQSARAASESLGGDLQSLRTSLGSGKKSKPRSAAVDGQASEQDRELLDSIDALSSVLDSKLALIAEGSCELLAGTATSERQPATAAGMSKPPCPVEDYAVPAQPPAPAPSEDDPVVRTDVGSLDDSADMCLHSDSMDDVDEALDNEEQTNGATGVQDAGENEQDDGGYDDDFESSIVVAEGGEAGGDAESQVSDEVVDKLNETHKKLDLLERLLTPSKSAPVSTHAATAEAHGAGDCTPGQDASAAPAATDAPAADERKEAAAPGDAAAPAQAAAHAASAEAVAPAAPVPAAPVSRIASKPFSFKNKAGGGGAAQGNLMTFFNSGPTMLNANQNKGLVGQAEPSAADPTPTPTSAPTSGAAQPQQQLGGLLQPVGAHAHVPSEPTAAAAVAETCTGPGTTAGDAQAAVSSSLAARAPPAGGRAGRGLLNFGAASAAPSAAVAYGAGSDHVASAVAVGAASSYQPAAPGGRAGRGLLDLGERERAGARSPVGDGVGEGAPVPSHQPVSARGGRAGRGLLDLGRQSPVEDCAGGAAAAAAAAAGSAPSRATTASSTASGGDNARREWTGGEGGDGGRGWSAGGKKKISKEEIRRAMLAAQGGGEPASVPDEPPAAAPVSGRRRAAEEDPRAAASEVRSELHLGELQTGDGGSDSQPPSARSFVAGRRGPVRATGPPRFVAGIGAEARAAQADAGLEGGGGRGGGGGAGRRSRSPVEHSSSLEAIDLGGGVRGGRGGALGGGAAVSSVLDSSLDRSLECEEL